MGRGKGVTSAHDGRVDDPSRLTMERASERGLTGPLEAGAPLRRSILTGLHRVRGRAACGSRRELGTCQASRRRRRARPARLPRLELSNLPFRCARRGVSASRPPPHARAPSEGWIAGTPWRRVFMRSNASPPVLGSRPRVREDQNVSRPPSPHGGRRRPLSPIPFWLRIVTGSVRAASRQASRPVPPRPACGRPPAPRRPRAPTRSGNRGGTGRAAPPRARSGPPRRPRSR